MMVTCLHFRSRKPAQPALCRRDVWAITFPLRNDAYAWLYRKMGSRLNTAGDGAVWFWAQIRRQELVELCRAASLRCQVARERVLLSHYGDWHSALNRSPLVIELRDETDEEYMARLEDTFALG
jgi:hypothetical protein